jgi:predicted nucleic acid-binding protein
LGAGRVVLDSGALSALAARNGRVRRFIERAIEEEAEIIVPTIVIAESTTGTARDAEVNRVLNAIGIGIVALTESIARDAAWLRYTAARPRADTIDAIVVATGDASGPSIILTGDAGDLGSLAVIRGRCKVISLTNS